MAMAANGILHWGAEGAVTAQSSQKRAAEATPRFSSPQDAAEALFAELGLARFLAPATTSGSRLMGDIERFASRRTPENAPTTVARPVAVPRAASGLFAPSPRPAAQAIPTSPVSAPVAAPAQVADRASPEPAGVAGIADALAGPEADAAPGVENAATANGTGWLGLDLSQPREWTSDDLAMLMFRDRTAAADALSLRAEQAAAEIRDSLDAFIDPDAFDDDALEGHAGEEFASGGPFVADRAAA